MKKETEDIQSIVKRLFNEMYLNIQQPPQRIKKQYAKVQKIFIDMHYELDKLNDMKELERGRE